MRHEDVPMGSAAPRRITGPALIRIVWLTVLGALTLTACGVPAPSASPQPQPPEVTCDGVPDVRCDEAVASVARSLPNSPIVSIDVSCVANPCSPESGAMDTVVTLADGSQLRGFTVTWSEPDAGQGDGGPGAPAPERVADPTRGLPVEPTCQGLPISECRTMAETAFGELSDRSVTAILVHCTERPCTARTGAGVTIVSYADGSEDAALWEYSGD